MGYMAEALDAQINTRVPSRVRNDLEDLARERGTNPLSLARTLIDEALRRERHPGIVFREGAAGRRAALEGRRLDVWQVMETVWDSDGKIGDAASFLGLRPDQVQAAVAYYADYRNEIDEWVLLNQQEAERLEAAWERQQAALDR
jgi:uncharacterized protein (DUF433 family)